MPIICIVSKDFDSAMHGASLVGIPSPITKLVNNYDGIVGINKNIPVLFTNDPPDEVVKIREYLTGKGMLVFDIESMKKYISNLYEHMVEVRGPVWSYSEESDSEFEVVYRNRLAERFKEIQCVDELEFNISYYKKFDTLSLEPKTNNSEIIKYSLMSYLRGRNSYNQISVK